MLNNHKGFSLVEVLAALAIFTAAVSAALPILTHVYGERIAITEEREALEILQNTIQLMLLEGSVPTDESKIIHNGSTVYRLTFKIGKESDAEKVCISWTADNERRYRKCGYVKIPTDTP